MHGDKLVGNFGEGAVNLDLLLPGTEHNARRQAHRRVLGMVARQREKTGLLEAVDQPADICPIERSGAHGAGLAGRDQRAGPEKLRRIGFRRAARKFGFGVADGADVALPHENAAVGADQHGTEGMMAVRHRLAGDRIGGAEVGEHLVAGHERRLALAAAIGKPGAAMCHCRNFPAMKAHGERLLLTPITLCGIYGHDPELRRARYGTGLAGHSFAETAG